MIYQKEATARQLALFARGIGEYPKNREAGKDKQFSFCSSMHYNKRSNCSLFVTNKTLPSATDYLSSREAYQIELHRYRRLENMLKEALGASDAGDLEEKMLAVRSQKRHPAAMLIELFNQQGHAFDKAASLFDVAEDLQKRKVAAAQAQMQKDLVNLDC